MSFKKAETAVHVLLDNFTVHQPIYSFSRWLCPIIGTNGGDLLTGNHIKRVIG